MNKDLQTRIDRIKEECRQEIRYSASKTKIQFAKSLLVAIEAIERIHESLAVIPALRAQETLAQIASTWEGKGK